MHRRHLPKVLLLIETSRAYGRGLVEGIGCYLEEQGPWSIYYEERGLNDPLPPWLKDWRGDGIIARTVRKADAKRLADARCPVVELYTQPFAGLASVYPDQDSVGRMAADHFFSRGLEHVAFFSTDELFWSDERCKAFVRAGGERGLDCAVFEPPLRRSVADWPQSIERQTAQWVQNLPKPCGVFCASDLYAARLVNVCRNSGIAVPEQVAVLGVDNDTVMCSMSFPPLSSVDLDTMRIGYEAARLLDQLIEGKTPPTLAVRVEPLGIVTRQSSDVLAINDPDVVTAIRLIRQQACRGLSVAHVAHTVGLSRRVLEQKFRAVLRTSPKQEILNVRMDRAKQLLRHGDMITAVARKSGFNSVEYFSRAFHREMGMTPRDYRQNYRSLNPHHS